MNVVVVMTYDDANAEWEVEDVLDASVFAPNDNILSAVHQLYGAGASYSVHSVKKLAVQEKVKVERVYFLMPD